MRMNYLILDARDHSSKTDMKHFFLIACNKRGQDMHPGVYQKTYVYNLTFILPQQRPDNNWLNMSYTTTADLSEFLRFVVFSIVHHGPHDHKFLWNSHVHLSSSSCLHLSKNEVKKYMDKCDVVDQVHKNLSCEWGNTAFFYRITIFSKS